MQQNEQDQLAFQFQWEIFYQILQELVCLSTERNAVRWSQILKFNDEEIQKAFLRVGNDVIFTVRWLKSKGGVGRTVCAPCTRSPKEVRAIRGNCSC